MNIITEIGSASNTFKHIEESLQGFNYVISIECRSFSSDNLNEFTIDNLKTIFTEYRERINGEVIKIKWEELYDKVNHYLRYGGEEKGTPYSGPELTLNIIDENEWKKRINLFWETIKKDISLSNPTCFLHNPADFTYFGNFLMWGICFILVDENNNGIIIHIWAED